MSESPRTERNAEYMKCGQKTIRKSLYSPRASLIDTEVKSAQTAVYSRKQDGNQESVFHLCISYAKDIVNSSSVRKNNIYKKEGIGLWGKCKEDIRKKTYV